MILEAWRDGARFDGWSEHFSFDRWMAAAERALADTPVDVDWYTTREREQNEVLPWDHLDSGLDRDWLWQDWEDALAGGEVEDCRWTPCFDCGVCDHLGTQIQVGSGAGRAAAAARSPVAGGGLMAAKRSPDREIVPAGPAAADPLRQARAAAVLLAPRLPARPRAGAAPRRVPMAYSRRVHPAPEGLLRQLGPHRCGQ